MGRSFLIAVNVLITIAAAFAGTPSVDPCGFQLHGTLVQSFAEGAPVFGVQLIDEEIYVIRGSTSYIEVYDRSTFQRIPDMSTGDLQGPYDMVRSKNRSSFLFIASWFDAVNLTRIQPAVPTPTIVKWSFLEQDLTTLGLTGSSFYTGANILVTAAVSQKLKEFTPDGNLVSEITISDISGPRHSIKVASNGYAVCHGSGPPPELHRVCLVNENGGTVKCYGGDWGSQVGKLNTPARLELNKNNCILVADTGNKRVVLLNQDLQFHGNLINEDLEGPYRLFLDQEQNVLYVADNTVDTSGAAVSGRIKVFKV